MATVLIVMRKGSGSGNWQVYRDDDASRPPGSAFRDAGPLVGSVESWEDLGALANREGVESHQISGDGLEEMEAELGAKPE